MRILMPSIVDPSIDIGGAWTVTRGLLSVIRGEPLNAEVHVIPVPARSRAAHRTRQYASLARSLVSPFPAKIHFSRSAAMISGVRRALREKSFDLILINGSDLLWLLPYLPSTAAVALVAHNVEHELFADQIACQSAPGLLQALLRRDCERLRAFELENLETIHNVIFLSQRDADSVRRHGLLLNTLTVPPLFDPPPLPGHRVRQPTSGLVEAGMIANFKWWPNRQALAWFLGDVMPRLNGNLRIHLFGSASERASDHPQLVRHGYVDDIEAIWEMCDFMISPLIRGGGVSVKTAHAISQRVPIVATSKAVRGLALDADPAIVLLDCADDWVSFLNSSLAENLGGRDVAWTTASRFHPDAYRNVIADFLCGASGYPSKARPEKPHVGPACRDGESE
jgi:hypothetical protein